MNDKQLTISVEEAAALIRAFRLVATQNTEPRMGRPCEQIVCFAEDVRKLERAAKRLKQKVDSV